MLTFEFAALNFVLPHRNRYAYRLEGLDAGWNDAGGRNTATYARIPPGRYTLRVRAANNDGVWNEEGIRLALTVTPPFWGTVWFRSLLGLAIAGGLLLAHRRRTGRTKARSEELARLVEERTAEVVAANKELEAFAYSVSHDLRAPLRSIDGYAGILATDLAPQLDDEGRRLLGLVRDRARRMEHLIDDLLAFSRLGRQGITPTTVDLGALITAVWDDLGRHEPRMPALDLRSLDPAWCDPAMIRQVLVNLLSNAVKFTAPAAEPRVEVGQSPRGSETVYYVKDNGVGFDARYASKLFGVFQRLHSVEDFEGTGVGLAIVERIVRRHGGQVFAEGEVGHGARFSFSLPRPPAPHGDGV
jgi:signal transduction histidine kinase